MSFGVESRLRVAELYDFHLLTYQDLIEICNSSSSGAVIYSGRNLISAVKWRDQTFVVKSFAIPWGPRQWIYGCLRSSKAERSFKNARQLLKLGLFTPKPVGYLETGGTCQLKRSFYVAEYASDPSGGPYPLRDVLLDPAYPGRDRILSELGRYTYLLHERGVCHRDYSPGNILVSQLPKNQGIKADASIDVSIKPTYCRFDLVDLNRMSFGRMSLKRRMHNLRLLWAEDKDLELIVNGYAMAMTTRADELFRLALKESHKHKRRANLEEMLKEKLRTFLGSNSEAKQKTSVLHADDLGGDKR